MSLYSAVLTANTGQICICCAKNASGRIFSSSPNASFSGPSSSSNSFPLVFAQRTSLVIPPLVYLADDFLPARFDASVLGDVPVQLYRHQRLKRALGVLPFGVSLSPGLSPPRRSGDIPIGRGQFAGSFSIVTWNGQALFASRSSRHAAKAAYVYRLCAQFDIILLQECHGTLGRNASLVAAQRVYGVLVAWPSARRCRHWHPYP